MSGVPAIRPPRAPPIRAHPAAVMGHLSQRLRERDFWLTQAGVLAVTVIHVLAELVPLDGVRDIPPSLSQLTVVLYLAPISYACLRYGLEGAVLTGLWCVLLTVPNVLVWHRSRFEWLELAYVAVVVGAGALMSIPVDRERHQRRRAEVTMQRQALLRDIASHTLWSDLSSTLDEALRRLVDMLGLEMSCVAVGDPTGTGDEALSVLACQSRSTRAEEPATIDRVRTDQPSDDPTQWASRGQHVEILPLTANLPEGQPVGGVDGLLVSVASEARRLSDEDRQLLASVASLIAVAITNERLTERERRRLRSYAMLVTRAQEDERKRIARELHDEASQNLVVIGRGLAEVAARVGDHPVAGELARLRDVVGQSTEGIRRFTQDLRPPTLDALGVASALEQLVAHVPERTGLVARFHVRGEYRRLPTEAELALFRTAQEALHNTERHAAATTVDVTLAFRTRGVHLSVVDDGCGFLPPEHLEELPEIGRLGLIGMRERAQLVGGTLRIRSHPGTGTRVDLDVPD